MKKVVGVVLVLVAIVGIAFFLKSCGPGIGPGTGTGNQNSESKMASSSSEQNEIEVSADSEKVSTSSDVATSISELPQRINVRIKGDNVFVGDKKIKDADELREYLEEINTDEREYILIDENSILATYEWVHEVFKEMNITLLEENN